MCAVHGPLARCKCGYARASLALVLFAAGCGLLPSKAPDVDPCSKEITRLEGLRSAEVLAACHGQAFDKCAAVERINAKYDPLIQAQVRCDQ